MDSASVFRFLFERAKAQISAVLANVVKECNYTSSSLFFSTVKRNCLIFNSDLSLITGCCVSYYDTKGVSGMLGALANQGAFAVNML